MNIVSLRKDKHELEIILIENDIDIIGLSETRLNEQIEDSEVEINGCCIFQNDRYENGGGLALYANESLSYPAVKLKREKLELLSIEISSTHAKFFLVVRWYRSPTSGVDEEPFENLRDTLKQLDKGQKEIVLIGDTNYNLVCKQNNNTKRLKAIYSEYQLEQLVKSYTRVSTTTNELNEQRISKTLIDHFSTIRQKYIYEVDVLELGMVDHYLVYEIRKVGNKKLTNKKQKIIESSNLNKYDKVAFQYDLQQIEWENILSPLANDPNRMAATFQEIFEKS